MCVEREQLKDLQGLGLVGIPEEHDADRELAVRMRAVSPPRNPRRERPLGQERTRGVESEIPRGARRHRDDRLLGEHRDDHIDVAALPGVDVGRDDLAHAGVPERPQRLLLAEYRELLLDRLVRALQSAIDGLRSGLERLGDLLAGEPEHVTKNQHGALTRREVL